MRHYYINHYGELEDRHCNDAYYAVGHNDQSILIQLGDCGEQVRIGLNQQQTNHLISLLEEHALKLAAEGTKQESD